MAQAQQAGYPSQRQPHKYKKDRFAHTQNTKYGMGDNYGTGIRAKLGRIRDATGMATISKEGLKKPPRSLA
jgi:hypothetical protein